MAATRRGGEWCSTHPHGFPSDHWHILSKFALNDATRPLAGRSTALKKLLPILCLACVAVSPAARWGYDAHRLLNRAATTHLPADFELFAQWTDRLEELSTAADERRGSDPDERIKHYIDIDDYPEFFTGQLPHSYQDMVALYGRTRVDANGTAPWAIEAAYNNLVTHFQAGDWDQAVAAAADVGHYVGDLHNPMHLTLNYNGQLTGQDGIHSRHESRLTARHLSDLVPAPGTISTVSDPLESVFGWIDKQYPGVAMILSADQTATSAAGGNTSSEVYYDRLWAEVGAQTTTWIRDASLAIASLWYAAWAEAGSPPLPNPASYDAAMVPRTTARLLPNTPNPFAGSTDLRFELDQPGWVTLQVFDIRGRRVRIWDFNGLSAGRHSVLFDGRSGSGARLPSGVYQNGPDNLRTPGPQAGGRASVGCATSSSDR